MTQKFAFTIFLASLFFLTAAWSQDDLCEGLVNHQEQFSIPFMSKPEPLEPFLEPSFKTKITRISAAEFGQVVKPMYNTIQSWNADESLLMLYHTGLGGAGHHLYDGKTYAYLRPLNISPRDLEQLYWHHSDPNIFYYLSKASPFYGQFMAFDVRDDSQTILHDFTDVCADGVLPTAGNDPQMISWDSDVVGLRCPAEPFQSFYYRLSTDSLSKTINMGENTSYSPWYALNPAPSGTRFFQQGDVLNTDLELELSLDVSRYANGEFKAEHSVMGQLSNGHDAYFVTNYNASPLGCDDSVTKGIGFLTAYDLETGECRVVVGEHNGFSYPHSGVHASSLATQQPGWVAMSSIAYGQFDYFDTNEPAPVLVSELFLVNTDPDDFAVCRLAHSRSFGKDATQGDYTAYFGEPHPVISPSGTRILFGSDWYDSGSVDSYVIELPSY